MISDRHQKSKLKTAMELIESVLEGNASHKNQSVYLSVAGEYCRLVSKAENMRAAIAEEIKSLEMYEDNDDDDE